MQQAKTNILILTRKDLKCPNQKVKEPICLSDIADKHALRFAGIVFYQNSKGGLSIVKNKYGYTGIVLQQKVKPLKESKLSKIIKSANDIIHRRI